MGKLYLYSFTRMLFLLFVSALPCSTRVFISYQVCSVFKAQARLGCRGNRQDLVPALLESLSLQGYLDPSPHTYSPFRSSPPRSGPQA